MTSKANTIRVLTGYEDTQGQPVTVPKATRDKLKALLAEPPADYVPRASAAAYQPPALSDGGRVFGIAVQLYALRSGRNWGIGDFTDLARLLRWAQDCGASYVGVNPLHALFPAAPSRRSPYYPSSRLFLNTVYVDPRNVPEARRVSFDGADWQARIVAARRSTLVDYPAVTALKYDAFRALYEAFCTNAPAGRRAAFETFCEDGGEALYRHALFDALHACFTQEGIEGGFPDWPADYHAPDGVGVTEFAQRHGADIAFYQYCQFIADEQLRAVAAGTENEPPIALYLDLAVGAAPDGAEAWSGQDHIVTGARLGAPPDAMNALGQDWGLSPMDPVALQRADYEPFADILRASMRYAGALRIDHILGFNRQFWIPEGVTAGDGGYVSFPQDDLIAVTARESGEAECLVIGEDLGTVPEGLTETLHAAGLLSYEVACWARDEDGDFLTADAYPRECLAVASTHDIAPVMGFMNKADLDVREALNLYPSTEDQASAREERGADREGLLSLWGVANETDPDAIVRGAHAFLGRSRAAVTMLSLEDLILQEEQMNLPGTVDEHPNWQRRYAMTLEEITDSAPVRARAEAGRRS